MKVKKGDIVYLVKSAYQKDNGNIQGGVRPLLVVSNDVGNHFSNICLVVPLTTKLKQEKLPTHTMLSDGDKTITVLCEQIFTINQDDIYRIARKATEEEMQKVDCALKNSLGI